MMNKIKDQIKIYGFSDYKIIKIITDESQFYLLKNNLESKRSTETRQYEITVYLDHIIGGNKFRGEYTFDYKPSQDLNYFLEQAKIACGLVKNRYYSLARPNELPEVKIFDDRLSKPHDVGYEIIDTIYNRCKDKNIYLSSAEIFITNSDVFLETSTGIEAYKKKGLIEFDITIMCKKRKIEQELNFNLIRRNVDDLDLANRLEEYKKYVKDMTEVQTPKSGKANVIFNATDIYALFSPIIFHSSGPAKDKEISRFILDKGIIKEPNNSFTLKSSGIIPFGLYSEPFDDEGTPGQEHTIIENGIFKKYWANKKYADYLGIEPTGSFKNLIVEPTVQSEINCDKGYEIIQFSDFSPDTITGDFVAEIRFGYYHDQGNRTPIKGGSVGGNLFDALNQIYLSRDKYFVGNYHGPKQIALANLSIAGG